MPTTTEIPPFHEASRDVPPSRVHQMCGRLGQGQFFQGTFAVNLTFLTQFFIMAATEISIGSLFDPYLKSLYGNNSAVGVIESARGILTFVFALPLGCMMDNLPKAKVMRLNLIVGTIAAILLAIGFPTDTKFLFIAGCLVMSVHNQCIISLLPVVLRDFTGSGTVTQSKLQAATSLGRASGPLFQLVLIAATGVTEWHPSQIHWILFAGLVCFALLYVPSTWRLQQLHNAREVSENERAWNGESSGSVVTPCWHWVVACHIELINFSCAVGSGMTFKYWSLFFQNDFNFSPAGVCAMNFATWIGIAATNFLILPLVPKLGGLRLGTILEITATGFLYAISSKSLGIAAEVPLVIIRNSLMNSWSPLLRDLLLDVVPPQHRGKWTSVASLSRTTWSGSAFIGGFLSDAHGYRYAFFITACVHSVTGALLVLLNIALRWRPINRPVSATTPLVSNATPFTPQVSR